MEKAIKKIAALFVIATISIFTVVASDINVTVEGNKLIRLSINEIANGLVLTFKDAAQVVMYTEQISDNEYTKRIDLNQLPDGVYSIEIEDELKLRVVGVNVNETGVELEKVRTTLAKPSIVAYGKLVKMQLLPMLVESLELSIYNDNNVLLHIEVLDTEVEVRKIFDFTLQGRGKYRFVIKNEAYHYIQNIEVM